MRWWTCAVMVGMVWVVLAGRAAWANGIYYPEQAVVEMPRIPLQRALITYRNGVETLVLESALTTQAKSVGWVVPLPSEPTKVELGDADMLRMLAVSQGEEVVHDLTRYGDRPGQMLIGMIPLAIAVICTRNPVRRPGFWILASILFLLGVAIAVPQFTNAGLSPSDAVTVSAVHRMGDFEAVVLRAKTPEALDEWLGKQGLTQLDAAARGIVQQYIERDWCFVVSRLVAEGTAEEAVPRPLVMSFATAECVFPMRLTQLAGGATRVELYVAADRQARAIGFKCVAADRYEYRPAGESFGDKKWFDYPVYRAERIGLTITNVDAQGLLWDGCVVTYLTADLTPAQMTNDVTIGLAPLKVYRERVYTARARLELMEIAAYWSGVGLVGVAAGAFFGRRMPGKVGWACLAGVLVAGTGVVVGIAWALPVVPAVVKAQVYPSSVQSWQQSMASAVTAAVLNGNLDETSRVEDVLPTLVSMKQCTELVYQNPVTQERVRYERTPGNMSMRVVEGRKYLCLYGIDGEEYRVPMFREGTTREVGK